ncbi:MAG: undecaprenyl-diphosphate phosphatase, partial [Chloroflexota bacterium]
KIPSDEKTFAFSVIVQLGTLFAMLVFFWKDLWQIASAWLLAIKNRKLFESQEARLGWYIILATIPALLIGYVLRDVVQKMFGEPFLQAGFRLLISAGLLFTAEFFDRRKRSLESVTWLDALFVGFFQVLAVFPGASRSGTTISGGMIRGLDRPSAARFAFLISAPILLAAGLYESIKVIEMPGTHEFLPYLVTGFVSAAVVGWLAIRWLLHYLSRNSLYVFAAYCALLGSLVLFLHFS